MYWRPMPLRLEAGAWVVRHAGATHEYASCACSAWYAGGVWAASPGPCEGAPAWGSDPEGDRVVHEPGGRISSALASALSVTVRKPQNAFVQVIACFYAWRLSMRSIWCRWVQRIEEVTRWTHSILTSLLACSVSDAHDVVWPLSLQGQLRRN
jgi:hypothetical protein